MFGLHPCFLKKNSLKKKGQKDYFCKCELDCKFQKK